MPIADVLVFCLWSKVHCPLVWDKFASACFECLVVTIAGLMDAVAMSLSVAPLDCNTAMPVLLGPCGKARRVDSWNKFLFLTRMDKTRTHRNAARQVLLEGLTPNFTSGAEALQRVQLYGRKVIDVFAGVNQLALAWDGSTHGGQETVVVVVYAHQLDKAAYLPVQILPHILKADLDSEFAEVARAREVERLKAFGEMRAIAHAITGICQQGLEAFQLPPGLLARAVRPGEIRMKVHGCWCLVQRSTGKVQLEVPRTIALHTLPTLVLISDQGPHPWAVQNFLQHNVDLRMMVVGYNDPFHRAWSSVVST
jgi:hypothetical protein